jgi:hypothetical protein
MTTTPKPFRGPGWPTFARELLDVRNRLTLADHIALALRAHRRALGLSQRAYAARRGWSKSAVAKLEVHADSVSLGVVSAALSDTGYQLCLVKVPEPATGQGAPLVVSPTHWDRVDLLAVVRDGSRRFPGHRPTVQVSHPPKWWWDRESTIARSSPPNWYCAQPPICRVPAPVRNEASDPSDGELPAAS